MSSPPLRSPAPATSSPRNSSPPNPASGRLIAHLLAAKRSLQSINHVWRANELVTSARQALEQTTVSRARTGYIFKAIENQLKLLLRIRSAIGKVGTNAQREFESILQTLDQAGDGLKAVFDKLDGTSVDDSISPATPDSRQTLLDFVDEDEVDKLRAKLDQCIERTQHARITFSKALELFDDEIDAVKRKLARKSASSSESSSAANIDSSSSTNSSRRATPMTGYLADLESKAKDMAELLESLGRHFDFCVSAVKQTEAGSTSTILKNVTGSVPEDLDLHLSTSSPLEPMTDEDRQSMLDVIEKDAGQVDDVVQDISEHLTSMEAIHEQVIDYERSLGSRQKDALSAFTMLETIGSKIPTYISQSQEFLLSWSNEAAEINTHLESLAEMRDFYAGFLQAYHGLVVEINRRRNIEARMNAIMRDAVNKVEKLYQEDVEEREAFRTENGFYLPADIWPGLEEMPHRFTVRKQAASGSTRHSKASPSKEEQDS